jgi:transposase InsO family protein
VSEAAGEPTTLLAIVPCDSSANEMSIAAELGAQSVSEAPPPTDPTATAEEASLAEQELAAPSRRIDGYQRQVLRHAEEELVRNQAAELSDTLIAQGCRCQQVAQRLHVPRRTLSRWRSRRQHPQPILPRGRPCKESSPTERRAVIAFLVAQGAHLGLPTLRSQFPHMPRCELHDLQITYRRRYRAARRRSAARLKWKAAGTVWAIDHVVPPSRIDGVHSAVLAVRDLGSGMQLGWLPVLRQTAQAAIPALERLFFRYGPPLVLKSDNGSAFIKSDFQDLLARHGTQWLPSPARSPWYNGGCEAGNGTLRIRTNHFAGPTGVWTADCLEAARQQANELSHPFGHLGPTPADCWRERTSIALDDRAEFLAAVARNRQAIITALQDSYAPRNRNQERYVQRQAACQALLDAGLLTITWRSIRLPISPKKWARFS